MTLKVRPIPEASAIAWVPFAGGKPLSDALDQLNTSGTRPIALDLLNPPAASSIGRELDLPGDGAVLVLGFEDNAESVRWQIDRLRVELGRTALTVVEGEQTASLWDALTAFQALEIGPISFVANVRPSSVATWHIGLDPAKWSVQAHAGNGIVRGHALGNRTLEDAAAEIEALRQAAVRDGGNLVLSRCPTEWKERLRVWGEPRPDWAIGERVRAALDPHGAMNPGRFVF
jgi:glycolate oxidase FAD binding subunit